jgi:CDP-6-deoxy-D-xylo-4-hexulose-3-dehydrase
MSDYWYPLSVNTFREEEIEAATAVLRSGNTTMGEKVEEFEEAFARFVDSPHAVMVNSGSSADLLAARALDLRGEVIIPAVTWPTHVWSWVDACATVRFCDVDEVNTTTALIAKQMVPGITKAISVPHLMGIPVELPWATGELALHEDCCEALGATYKGKPVGYWSDVASWSFFFSHQMSTMEGGMVTTPHQNVYDRLRSLRSHGWTRHKSDDKYTFDGPGYNVRPTEVAAAIGLVQLKRLPAFNAWRKANHAEFERVLRGHPNITLPAVPEFAKPSWFGVPMFIENDRDGLARRLEEAGVETRPILAGNLKAQPGFRGFYFGKTPGADRVQDHGLYVGLHPVASGHANRVAKLIGELAQ